MPQKPETASRRKARHQRNHHIHRSLTPSPLSRWLPRLAALAAAFVGIVNVGSALTPNIRWRGHLLLDEMVSTRLPLADINRGPKNQIETGAIRSLGMTFGGEKLLRATVSELVKAHQQ